MTEKIFSLVSAFIIAAISSLGYGGVILLMAIAGAVGCLLGSYVAYFIGANSGRWFLLNYGRWVLIAPHEIELADWFFDKWGRSAVFISRLLPVVRTFIALPAGVSRMRLLPFTVYTLAGSYLWCLALAYAGMKLGQHWEELAPYFHRFDTIIAILILAGAALVIYNRIRSILRTPLNNPAGD